MLMKFLILCRICEISHFLNIYTHLYFYFWSCILYLTMIHPPQNVAYTDEANNNLLWLTVITLDTTRRIRTDYVRMYCAYIYTGCNRRNGPNFGKVFLMLNYTEKTQNTCIQS
jgi:hypothetical protein